MNRDDYYKPPQTSAHYITVLIVCVGVVGVVIDAVLASAGARTFSQIAYHGVVLCVLGVVTIAATHWLHGVSKRVRRERLPAIHVALAIVPMIFVYTALGIVFFGSIGVAFTTHLWMIPLYVGGMMIQVGMVRRVGESLHCPSCEYEFNYPDEPGAPERCPECGTKWLGRLKKGRRLKSTRMMAWGIIVIVVGVVVLQPMLYINAIAKHMPTCVLYPLLYFSPSGGYRAWDELAQRPLATPWNELMARRIVGVRRAADWNAQGGSWFKAAAARGDISNELVERYYKEALEADLDVPMLVGRGEQFTVALQVRHIVTDGPDTLGIYFAGYTVGDSTAVGREAKTVWSHDFRRAGLFARREKALVRTLVAPDRPGSVTIRATYWIVHAPSFWERLKWQADGTPERPSDAYWFERVELKRVVKVW